MPSWGCQEGMAAAAAGGEGQSERRYARALGVPSGARVGLHVALPLAAARDGGYQTDSLRRQTVDRAQGGGGGTDLMSHWRASANASRRQLPVGSGTAMSTGIW